LDKIEKIIDLKKEESFIEAYVSLRNLYSELLLTKPVSVVETREWLKSSHIEAMGIVQDSMLLGAVILYLNRKGEIAFFTKHQNQGIGTKLLKIVEQVAKEKNLKSVWAWVLFNNQSAQKTFQKNGYTIEGQLSRFYEGESKTGIIFRKKIP
jgi:RimJ/RimL family protein N-acetyltransferase